MLKKGVRAISQRHGIDQNSRTSEYLLRQISNMAKTAIVITTCIKVRILTKEARYIAEIASRCFPELGYNEIFGSG